ncbi:MAG TPA: ATP-binding cassette domain-containing protein [Chromatiales bacterium]|nr:ATP-binding cassette domain-containing protein [Chromatiales bacterium]
MACSSPINPSSLRRPAQPASCTQPVPDRSMTEMHADSRPGTGPHKPGQISFAEVIELLERNGMNNVGGDPVYVACLMPLLEGLGWETFTRELLEALPHFAGGFELIELRNVLANLGYDSHSRRQTLRDIRDELLPCLFIADNGDVLVLLGEDSSGMRCFDARAQRYVECPVDSTRGTAYLFTNNREQDQSAPRAKNAPSWFGNLLRRFRGLVVHLLAMTLFVNLVALIVPLFIMMVYDKVIGARSIDTLPMMLAGLGVAIGTDLGMRVLRARILGRVAGRLEYLIGVASFRQILLLPPGFTEKSAVNAQLSRLRQFDSIRDFFTGATAGVILDLPFTLLFLGVIGILAGWIALIPLLTLCAYFLFGLFWFPGINARVLRAGRARTERQRLLMETLTGRREIKGAAAESSWAERYREVSGEAVTSQYETAKATAILNSVAQALMALSGTAVLAFSTLKVIDHEMSIGGLIAVMALVWRVLSPMQSLFLSYTKLDQILQTIQQINQLMKLPVERDTAKSALLMPEIKGHICFDRVSLRYSADQDPALLGVSFKVEPGQLLAITGTTGAGKSTILKLIAGMYQPQGGALLLDNTDIRQMNPIDLRRSIAYVPQQPRLFYGSIAQNIRLPNMLATDEELHAAAEKAGVLDTILAMPEGFETRIGDGSINQLPPGFVQGLCMARAHIRNAPIILLDEPGASLDYEADANFMQQLKRMKGERTMVMISHRPSHIRLVP